MHRVDDLYVIQLYLVVMTLPKTLQLLVKGFISISALFLFLCVKGDMYVNTAANFPKNGKCSYPLAKIKKIVGKIWIL